ncbi:hypothetical protein [Jiangella mangrovi]|uniref:Uncharacterized protein n=1 Tax=Jiangella mangrovi TaxID=1524084 RepID=A0A7W9GP18_9ACTN|nr:hypothetical protein [Jiangella mangrovi]MBB5787163.1 hypothetical protein [Jiangella mangrovi]
MRHHGWIVAVPVAALLFLAACGTEEAPVSASPSDPPVAVPASDPDQTYTGLFTVLEDAEHGPQLCSMVMDSYPPQCGGPDVAGWNWDEAPDAETANGVTWGFYSVTGTWDGTTLTLTEPPLAGAATSPMVPDGVAPDFTSPCEAPAGGWAVVDAATTTQATFDAAMAHAAAQPDFAGSWMDQSPFEVTPENEPERMNHPEYLVLNAQFTGDLERHEAELRQLWGGALCVSEAANAMADLEAVQAELTDSVPNLAGVGVDTLTNTVSLEVFVDDGLQEELDQQYGAGVVQVTASLQPVG